MKGNARTYSQPYVTVCSFWWLFLALRYVCCVCRQHTQARLWGHCADPCSSKQLPFPQICSALSLWWGCWTVAFPPYLMCGDSASEPGKKLPKGQIQPAAAFIIKFCWNKSILAWLHSCFYRGSTSESKMVMTETKRSHKPSTSACCPFTGNHAVLALVNELGTECLSTWFPVSGDTVLIYPAQMSENCFYIFCLVSKLFKWFLSCSGFGWNRRLASGTNFKSIWKMYNEREHQN